MNLYDFINQCEMGVGELLIQNINLDGKAKGYDVDVNSKVVNMASVPVIECSGAGKPEHFIEVAKIEKLSGIAAGNYFNFKELSYPMIKEKLKKKLSNVR